jgi:quinol monooxygenase YgiN
MPSPRRRQLPINHLDVVAAVFEARMDREQAERLAELMQEGRATRPVGVLTAALLVDGDLVRLVAFWKDRETLERYLATAEVPRGTELMRKVGVEPELRIVDVLELG